MVCWYKLLDPRDNNASEVTLTPFLMLRSSFKISLLAASLGPSSRIKLLSSSMGDSDSLPDFAGSQLLFLNSALSSFPRNDEADRPSFTFRSFPLVLLKTFGFSLPTPLSRSEDSNGSKNEE